ncbi:hypothetical protein [Halorhodospira halophila]|uniref:hypothetical protein n=1 Tax=Halorhodospira halophila TaxID=1053 RepID=UPI0019122ECF|nr:hypothetical protein [Halorhodospira halophila]MBK5944829.1 hypothetical protein [Halorhodospira halophila]
MTYYTETVHRFRIMRWEELPETHQRALREKGIDPDDRWSLIYSTPIREDAETMLGVLEEEYSDVPWRVVHRIEDAGEPTTISRPIY